MQDNQDTIIAELRNEVAHYKDIAELSGRKRLLEVAQLDRLLIEKSNQQKELLAALNLNSHVLDSTDVGIVVYNENGQCIVSNQAAAQIIGATVKQVLAQNFNAISSWQQTDLLTTAKEAMRKNEKTEKTVFIRSSFGKEICVHCRFCPFIMHKKTHLLLVFEDVTEQKMLEKRSQDMQDRLHLNNRLAAIGTLAAGIGHEINNPLAILSGNIDVLKSIVDLTDNNKKVLDAMERSIERIAKIVHGLKTFATTTDENFGNCDLNTVVTDTISFISGMYAVEDITIKTEFANNIGYCTCPISYIQQIILNLLDNSRDALRTISNKLILVKTYRTSDSIFLQIMDNGCGIEKDVLPKIFDLFFTTKSPSSGTGLGLSIVHKLITILGGNIEVDSSYGSGTVVTIKLPVKK